MREARSAPTLRPPCVRPPRATELALAAHANQRCSDKARSNAFGRCVFAQANQLCSIREGNALHYNRPARFAI
jgi:hypothetical protein